MLIYMEQTLLLLAQTEIDVQNIISIGQVRETEENVKYLVLK